MNIERQIEFDKIKEIWSELAITDWAKEKIREAGPFFSEQELKKQYSECIGVSAENIDLILWPEQ